MSSVATAGSRWAGLIRNMDPVDIPADASPDCANAFFYDAKRGLLGPRFGKSTAGYAEQSIVGVFPYRAQGTTGLLVAMANGTTQFLSSYTGSAPGGTLQLPATTAANNTTITIGPLQLTVNQFFQLIGGNWNGGIAGFTGAGTLCLLDGFNSGTCTYTYTKIVYDFDNGVCQNFTVTTGNASCP